MWKHRHSGSLPKLICFTRLFRGSAASTISCKVTRSVARMVTMMTVATWDTKMLSRVARLTGWPEPYWGSVRVMLSNLE